MGFLHLIQRAQKGRTKHAKSNQKSVSLRRGNGVCTGRREVLLSVPNSPGPDELGVLRDGVDGVFCTRSSSAVGVAASPLESSGGPNPSLWVCPHPRGDWGHSLCRNDGASWDRRAQRSPQSSEVTAGITPGGAPATRAHVKPRWAQSPAGPASESGRGFG